jgi:hypothetical protein
MKELYEFRIREKYAGRLFSPKEGTRLSIGKMGKVPKAFEELAVRRIEIVHDDPRFREIGILNVTLKENKDWFFAG